MTFLSRALRQVVSELWHKRTQSQTGSPAAVSAWLREAAEHVRQGDAGVAITLYQQVLAADPDNAAALYSLGVLHGQAREYARAQDFLEQVLADHPEHVDALNALGNLHKLQQRWSDARARYAQALALRPDHVPALTNLGLCLKNEGLPRDAIGYLERAHQLQPGAADVLLNYGLGQIELGQFSAGKTKLQQALNAAPHMAEAHLALGLQMLCEGNFADGWREYEWRTRTDDWERQVRYECPVWDGGDLAGKTLLVRAEQGIGDQLMFASCFPEIVDRARTCVLECESRLKPILARSFPKARVYAQRRSGIATWIADGLAPDVQIQMGSLPYRLGRGAENFPRHAGYLKVDSTKASRRRAMLDAAGPGLKVGISWRGGTRQTRQSLRSIPLEHWQAVLRAPGIQFVSLQYGDCAQELAAVSTAFPGKIIQWADAIDDLDETAALVAGLDLIISVQTAIVHLAGALGRPVWALVPQVAEWRYLQAGDRMPWYPSVRLYRLQDGSSWPVLIERVAGDLARCDRSAAAIPPPSGASP